MGRECILEECGTTKRWRKHECCWECMQESFATQKFIAPSVLKAFPSPFGHRRQKLPIQTVTCTLLLEHSDCSGKILQHRHLDCDSICWAGDDPAHTLIMCFNPSQEGGSHSANHNHSYCPCLYHGGVFTFARSVLLNRRRNRSSLIELSVQDVVGFLLL